MEWDGWCNGIGVQWEGIASCSATFDSVLEQHWLQDHIGSNYHTRCTESAASGDTKCLRSPIPEEPDYGG